LFIFSSSTAYNCSDYAKLPEYAVQGLKSNYTVADKGTGKTLVKLYALALLFFVSHKGHACLKLLEYLQKLVTVVGFVG